MSLKQLCNKSLHMLKKIIIVIHVTFYYRNSLYKQCKALHSRLIYIFCLIWHTFHSHSLGGINRNALVFIPTILISASKFNCIIALQPQICTDNLIIAAKLNYKQIRPKTYLCQG